MNDRHSLPRRTYRDRGFTLLELLVVLALIATLMGIGTGLFKKVGSGRALALSAVKDNLRATRTFAIEQSAVASLQFRPEDGAMISSSFLSVGNWHFEDERSRGWPTDADLSGGLEIASSGAIGRSLRIPRESRGFAALGNAPSFNPDHGILIDLFVKLEESQDRPILAKGLGYQLLATGDDGVALRVRCRERGVLGQGEGETRSIAVSGGLSQSRFVHVQASYDGRSLRIELDGRVRGVQEFTTRATLWPDVETPLTIGTPDSRFLGSVDEVRISSLVLAENHIAEEIRFEKPLTVYFDPSGRLDPLRHTEPVAVTMIFDGDRKRDVVVGLFGEIQ